MAGTTISEVHAPLLMFVFPSPSGRVGRRGSTAIITNDDNSSDIIGPLTEAIRSSLPALLAVRRCLIYMAQAQLALDSPAPSGRVDARCMIVCGRVLYWGGTNNSDVHLFFCLSCLSVPS